MSGFKPPSRTICFHLSASYLGDLFTLGDLLGDCETDRAEDGVLDRKERACGEDSVADRVRVVVLALRGRLVALSLRDLAECPEDADKVSIRDRAEDGPLEGRMERIWATFLHLSASMARFPGLFPTAFVALGDRVGDCVRDPAETSARHSIIGDPTKDGGGDGAGECTPDLPRRLPLGVCMGDPRRLVLGVSTRVTLDVCPGDCTGDCTGECAEDCAADRADPARDCIPEKLTTGGLMPKNAI